MVSDTRWGFRNIDFDIVESIFELVEIDSNWWISNDIVGGHIETWFCINSATHEPLLSSLKTHNNYFNIYRCQQKRKNISSSCLSVNLIKFIIQKAFGSNCDRWMGQKPQKVFEHSSRFIVSFSLCTPISLPTQSKTARNEQSSFL